MANNSSSLIKHHFFKPLIPDFLSNFSIPNAFLKHLQREDDEENYAILRDKRNEIWHVKLERENGKMYLKDGWQKFCKDHGLQIGDFLVFKYQGDFTFDVIIFDPTACERNFPPTPNVSSATKPPINNKGKGVKKTKESVKGGLVPKVGCFKPRGFPYCHVTVKSYWRKWGGMPIPTKFARANGLMNRRCEMVLIDEKEKWWSLSLRHSNSSPFIGGWGVFEESNALKVGDPLVFEIIDDSTPNPIIIRLYR